MGAVDRPFRYELLAAILACLAGTIVVAAPASALSCNTCTFYVRAAAAPGADGQTPETAFSSIAVAANAANNPGDVICVGPGSYSEGNLSSVINGIAGRPIEFRADLSGECTGDAAGAVVLSPPQDPGGALPTSGFLLLGRRHILIEGFTIRGFVDAGIQVRSAATGGNNSGAITIRDVDASRNKGSGIEVFGEDLISIENCRVVDNSNHGILVQACTNPSADSRCRGVPSRLVQAVLVHNRIGGNGQQGIFIQGASTGLLWNNVVYSNARNLGNGVTLTAAADMFVVNNLVYNNGGSGLDLGEVGSPSPAAVIVNNTLYANTQWGIRLGRDQNTASTDALVLSNILSGNGAGALTVSRPATCGYVAAFNLVDGVYGITTPSNLYDLNRTDTAPRFVAPAGADGVLGGERLGGTFFDRSADDDFHLQQRRAGQRNNSPAVDAGHSTVEVEGPQGSTATSGLADEGRIDLGFHYAVDKDHAVPSLPEIPFLPIYVRKSGNDANDGLSAMSAKATIGAASAFAQAGITVVVGPGKYIESNIGPPQNRGRAAFLADPLGTATEDEPDIVLIDPSLVTNTTDLRRGFYVRAACNVVIDGFHVWKANDAGIQLRDGANDAIVRNNFLFSNDRGVLVRNSTAPQIINNLIYDNGGGGITVDATSPEATVRSNTLYRNLNGNGVTIEARGGRVEYNVIDNNEFNGIHLGAAARSGYFAQYNLLNANGEGNWGGIAERGTGSLADVNPLFVDPVGADGILGGGSLAGNIEYFRDDRFELRQIIAGDKETSRAVDNAPITVEKGGLTGRTTRRDKIADSGQLDLGFHYPARSPEIIYVHPTDGSNSNSGLVPERPLATIAEALLRAEVGTTVQLFAEEYLEANLRPPPGVTIAGAGMTRTSIDAAGEGFVFDVRSEDVTILDMGITRATSAGIRARADGLRVANCWIHDNTDNGKGIFLTSGAHAIVLNNIIADNANTGIIVGASGSAAPKATIAHNSIVRNGIFGISVGLNSELDSESVAIVGNVITANAAVGLSLNSPSASKAQVDHNCNSDSYTGMSIPSTDIESDPLLSGEGTNGYFLAQVAAGQPITSPCVDKAGVTSSRLGLNGGYTRSDRVADVGAADLGFHYGVATVDFNKAIQALRDDFLSGDCNGDLRVSVAELVVAIRIALEIEQLQACTTLDRNGDGQIGVNEIVLAVAQALAG